MSKSASKIAIAWWLYFVFEAGNKWKDIGYSLSWVVAKA